MYIYIYIADYIGRLYRKLSCVVWKSLPDLAGAFRGPLEPGNSHIASSKSELLTQTQIPYIDIHQPSADCFNPRADRYAFMLIYIYIYMDILVFVCDVFRTPVCNPHHIKSSDEMTLSTLVNWRAHPIGTGQCGMATQKSTRFNLGPWYMAKKCRYRKRCKELDKRVT
jgi:hypothetical protein